MADVTPDLPAIAGSMPFIHNVDTAPAYWWLDILWVIIVHGNDTGGRCSLMHETLPKGSAAPPDKHTWSVEHFYINDAALQRLIQAGATPSNVQSIAGELQNASMNKNAEATRAQLPAIMKWFSAYTPAPSIIAMNG